MRHALCVALLVVLAVTTASAQSAGGTQQSNPGRAKMWIGAGLIAAGALVIPITTGPANRWGAQEDAGLAMMAAGTVVLWLGARERGKSARPATTVGVTLGRNTSVRIRRAW